MDFEGLKGKSTRDTSDAIDLALSDISADMMKIESWDFDVAMDFARRAYLIGSIAGAEYLSQQLKSTYENVLQQDE